MERITAAAISNAARALYDRELTGERAETLGEIVTVLAQSAGTAAENAPMEAEPTDYLFSLYSTAARPEP
jgi:hypothetical protein